MPPGAVLRKAGHMGGVVVIPDERVVVQSLDTHVPGLDAVVGGGLPEYSFNLIAGGPGAGKTTLAQQIAFGSARAGRTVLYFTVLGEPTLKMLRYQRQFTFFDSAMVGSEVEFVNLSNEALESGPAAVLERVVGEVERAKPRIVVVDSFRSVARSAGLPSAAGITLDHFLQKLAVQLTTWEVTSFLIGEYAEGDTQNPVFTVADGVLWLSQVTDRNSVVRKLHVVKMRGRAPMPGLHTFRITNGGIEVFPRIPVQQTPRVPQLGGRHGTGVPGLDELMGGGIPIGDVVMIAGPSGSGKTTFATQFVAEGARSGESVVAAVFEEYPEEYLARARARGQGLDDVVASGQVRLIYLRPLDLSVDETLSELLEAVVKSGATRVVIDSLSGFEVALAPAFREDFRESLYRLVGALTAAGVTVLLTAETVGGYSDLGMTSDRVFFVADDVIVQRYVEIGGRLQKVLNIVKMRGSEHSKEFNTYEVGASGAMIRGPLLGYRGIVTSTPDLRLGSAHVERSGLTAPETKVLDALIRLGVVSGATLARSMDLPEEQCAAALARLVAVGYATKDESTQLVRAVSS